MLVRRRGDSFPSLPLYAPQSLIIEGPAPSLVELLKSETHLLAQLIELIALLQQSERFTDHLTSRSVAPRADARGDDFFQFGG